MEVKLKLKITRSLRSFINIYKPKKGIIINLNNSYKTKIKNTHIFVIPAVCFKKSEKEKVLIIKALAEF